MLKDSLVAHTSASLESSLNQPQNVMRMLPKAIHNTPQMPAIPGCPIHIESNVPKDGAFRFFVLFYFLIFSCATHTL